MPDKVDPFSATGDIEYIGKDAATLVAIKLAKDTAHRYRRGLTGDQIAIEAKVAEDLEEHYHIVLTVTEAVLGKNQPLAEDRFWFDKTGRLKDRQTLLTRRSIGPPIHPTPLLFLIKFWLSPVAALMLLAVVVPPHWIFYGLEGVLPTVALALLLTALAAQLFRVMKKVPVPLVAAEALTVVSLLLVYPFGGAMRWPVAASSTAVLAMFFLALRYSLREGV